MEAGPRGQKWSQAAGPWGWGVGGGRLKGFWWHSIASAKYSSLPTSLEGPGSVC